MNYPQETKLLQVKIHTVQDEFAQVVQVRVCFCTSTYMCVVCAWRLEVENQSLSLLLTTVSFDTASLTEPSTHPLTRP